jgi:hypothetical protein
MAGRRRCSWFLWSAAMVAWLATGPWDTATGQSEAPISHDVVINEIHYDPDVKTEWVEFVELYNAGPNDVSLAGWRLCDGIRYTFGPEAVLPAKGYIIVAQDWESVVLKWSHLMIAINDDEPVYSPFEGRLGNDGQTVTLCDSHARAVDRVAYKLLPLAHGRGPSVNELSRDRGVHPVDPSRAGQCPGRQLEIGCADSGCSEHQGVFGSMSAACGSGGSYALSARQRTGRDHHGEGRRHGRGARRDVLLSAGRSGAVREPAGCGLCRQLDGGVHAR